MKKSTNKVKGFIIASVSVLCATAIVLGCVFGLRKPNSESGGGKPSEPKPAYMTAAQIELANAIKKSFEEEI